VTPDCQQIVDFHRKLMNFLPTLERRRPTSHPALPLTIFFPVDDLVKYVTDVDFRTGVNVMKTFFLVTDAAAR
jgi:hypothetical protein